MRASIEQVLDVWTLLEQAREGKSTYAGNVTEIYVYLFLRNKPMIETRTLDNDVLEEYQKAWRDFAEIFHEFERRRNCTIEIETASKIHGWLNVDTYFKNFKNRSRLHVKVTKND